METQRIITMRHGQYDENSENKELTTDGKSKIHKSGGNLVSLLGEELDGLVIVSSPVPRALQSAEILKTAVDKSLGESIQLIENDFLGKQSIRDYSDISEKTIYESLGIDSLASQIVVVSHMPFVEAFHEAVTGLLLEEAPHGTLFIYKRDAESPISFSFHRSINP